METTERLCLQCGRPLKGRIDKKFCDDSCRNSYNNRLKPAPDPYVRNVNAILARNRRLLEEIIPCGERMGRCPRNRLQSKGYDFTYHTHQITNRKGSVYTFCYELGYLPLEGDWLLVVKRKDDGAEV